MVSAVEAVFAHELHLLGVYRRCSWVGQHMWLGRMFAAAPVVAKSRLKDCQYQARIEVISKTHESHLLVVAKSSLHQQRYPAVWRLMEAMVYELRQLRSSTIVANGCQLRFVDYVDILTVLGSGWWASDAFSGRDIERSVDDSSGESHLPFDMASWSRLPCCASCKIRVCDVLTCRERSGRNDRQREV